MTLTSRYAAVTSTIALVVALGGTGYAVAKLPHNSVGTAQLKNNAVTSGKVKNHTLTSSDLKTGLLTPSAFTPIALFQLDNTGFYNQVHRAPITGKLTLTSPSAGTYLIAIPGLPAYSFRDDQAVCGDGSDSGRSVTATSSADELELQMSTASGAASDDLVTCAIYQIPPA